MSADVRCKEHDAVGGDQFQLGQVRTVTGGAGRDRRILRLLLIEERHRPSTAPAGQHHFGVAESILCIRDTRTEILDHFLHEQRRIVAAESAATADDVMTRPSQPVEHWQVRPVRGGMHEHQDGIRRLVDWPDQEALQHDVLSGASVDVADGRCVLEHHEIWDALILMTDSLVLHTLAAHCWRFPRVLAMTSGDGTKRCRVSIAIITQSTESYWSKVRRARSRALSGGPWWRP